MPSGEGGGHSPRPRAPLCVTLPGAGFSSSSGRRARGRRRLAAASEAARLRDRKSLRLPGERQTPSSCALIDARAEWAAAGSPHWRRRLLCSGPEVPPGRQRAARLRVARGRIPSLRGRSGVVHPRPSPAPGPAGLTSRTRYFPADNPVASGAPSSPPPVSGPLCPPLLALWLFPCARGGEGEASFCGESLGAPENSFSY